MGPADGDADWDVEVDASKMEGGARSFCARPVKSAIWVWVQAGRGHMWSRLLRI